MTDISSDTVIANLTGGVAATLSNRFSRVANVVDDFGAVGNGTTDDTVKIQNGITACAAKAALLFPVGYTFLHHGFTVPAGSQLIVNGTLELTSNTTAVSCLTITGSNVSITGYRTINGNASGQTGPTPSSGIVNTGSLSSIYIRGLNVTNCRSSPISLSQCNNSKIVECNLSSCGRSVNFVKSTNCQIIGNNVSSIGSEGIALLNGCLNCCVTDNVVSNSTSSGISLLNETEYPAACSNIIISRNISYSNGLSGIEANSGTGATGSHEYVIITENQCYDNNTLWASGLGAINIGNASNFVCSSNQVSGTRGSNAIGIYTSPSCSYGLIAGNVSFNQAVGSSLGYGIDSFSADSYIANNYVYDNQSAPTTGYGISYDGVSSSSSDNFVSSAIAQDVVYGTTPSQIADFVSTGYNVYKNIAEITSGFNVGLTIGWNQSNAEGEVDFVLAPGSYSGGGAYWFQANESGNIVSGKFESGSIIRTDGTGNFGALSYRVGSSSGPTWTSGSDAPTSTQPVGSLYSNTGARQDRGCT